MVEGRAIRMDGRWIECWIYSYYHYYFHQFHNWDRSHGGACRIRGLIKYHRKMERLKPKPISWIGWKCGTKKPRMTPPTKAVGGSCSRSRKASSIILQSNCSSSSSSSRSGWSSFFSLFFFIFKLAYSSILRLSWSWELEVNIFGSCTEERRRRNRRRRRRRRWK